MSVESKFGGLWQPKPAAPGSLAFNGPMMRAVSYIEASRARTN